MQERRKVQRNRTFLGGSIGFNRRRSTFDCLVRNFSAEGAMLSLTNAAIVPDAFDLTIPQTGRSYRARLVWRGEDTAGVTFASAIVEDSVPLDIAHRLSRSEAERLALKARVAELSEGG